MMKRMARPIYKVLFVFVFVAIAAALYLRMVVSVANEKLFITNNEGRTRKLPPIFNRTLLAFATVDLADDALTRDVEELVDADFPSAKSLRQLAFLSKGRYCLNIGASSTPEGPMDLMSPDFYKLWLKVRGHLLAWWQNRQFKPDVISNMVLESGKKYKTCAVVGNSGILLKTNLGDFIDRHEFVIRLNNARITTYERFVGSKTSLSFMNSNILHFCSRRQGCFCHPYGENVPIMLYMSQPVHFVDYVVCNSSHKAPLIITDPQLDVLCARIVKYYSVKRFMKETGKSLDEWASAHGGVEFHYSSGMQAIMVALGICDQVDIFGFGKSDSAKHHYHTVQRSELGLHHYEAEYDLYEDIVNWPEAVPFVSTEFKFPPVRIYR
ncbi:beta-1,6-galactosyltransferase GALT29A-like [Rutidosis leptorrhynchoides]|uniref:beta-1,6-galactosyltransferase GALT29A-like n=1 Tax=Rutidosis leptorrhynchoides TaxID=125765 RepID=UPI003A9966E2